MAKTTLRVICNLNNTASRLKTEPPITVGSKAWFEWVEVPQNRAFMFEPTASSTQPEMWNYSAQKEERRDDFYWYAYKRYKGKLYRHYLGQGKELNHEKLLQASRELANKFHNPPEAVPHRVKESSTNKSENSSTTITAVLQETEESLLNGTENSSTSVVELLRPDILQLEALRADIQFWRGRAIWSRSDMLTRQQLRDLKAEVAGLRSQLQDAANLVIKQRAEIERLSDVHVGSQLTPTAPLESLEAEQEQDFPADVVDDLEVMKELSDDSIPGLEEFGLEEVEEKHTSTATVATATKTKSPPVQLGLLPETETAPPQETKPRKRSTKEVKPLTLTRLQLAKKLGFSSDFIKLLESKGKLAEHGWASVEGTGTNEKNPPKYQPLESQEPT